MGAKSLQKRLERGERLIGAWACAGSALTIEALADLPFDFVVMDLQHGELDLRALLHVLPVFRSSLAVPIVRMLDHSAGDMGRVLDFGVEAVIVPNVNTPEVARHCIAAMHYAPFGVRSFGPMRTAHLRLPHGVLRKEAPVPIVQIETAEGLQNLDAILQTPGLGAAFIGPHDLHISMGLSQVSDLAPTVKTIVSRCQQYRVPLGSMAEKAEDAKRWLDLGVQFVSVLVDSELLKSAAKELLSAFEPSRSVGLNT